MKKYILMMLVVLVAGFTSCSNDDIPMEEKVTKKVFDTTFIVDPSGVVEPYRFEWTAGELSKVPVGTQLRLRILIYDSNGVIVGSILTNKQSNYQSAWSVNTELEAGTYTALVISDVINTNNPNVEEYWKLENYGRLNDLKLTKTPNYLGYQKEILGICNHQFSVGSLNSSISLDLKPAGAVCYFYSENVGIYPINLWYQTNMKYKSVFWDSSYNLKIDKEISDYHEYSLGGVKLDTNSYAVTLSFLLPSQNQHFAYYCETDDDYYMADQGSYIADIKAGEQYLFICSYDSGTHGYSTATRYWNVTGLTFDEWYQNPKSRRISVHHEMSELLFMQNTNNAVYIKDLIKK